MQKKKRIWPFILIGLIVLITIGTIYVNKVILPVTIKNIALTQAKNFLKRNVEIGNLHFNPVRGLIIDNIKIYQKDSKDIFVESKSVSIGVIFIPGFGKHQLTIPYIDILDPQVHLVRKGPQEWNFSDLIAPPATNNTGTPSNINISVLGARIINGHIIIDDKTGDTPFHQDIEALNLKVGLSTAGISLDTQADIKPGNGLVAIDGNYNPITKAVDSHVHLKNIDLKQYLSLAPAIPNITITSGIIKEIDVRVHYDEALSSVKGDINASDLKATDGIMAFQGSLEGHIDQCDIKKNSINIDSSISAREATITLSPSQQIKGTLSLEKVRIRQDNDGTQLVGTINAQNMDIAFDGQRLHGSFLARPITLEVNNQHDIDIKGDFKGTQINALLKDDRSFKGKVTIENMHLTLANNKEIGFEGNVSLDELDTTPIPNIHIAGSVGLKHLSLKLADNMLNIKTAGELNNWQINLDKDKSIIAEASFNVDATYPLAHPEKLTYTGNFELEHADVTGYPYGPYNAISAKGDIKTDQLSIKLFSIVALDSSFKGAATIMNFKDPVLSVDIAAESIDLGKIHNVLPDLYSQYGLSTQGSASVNASFEGLASNPLSGKINLSATLNNVDAGSTKFNQHVSGINGHIEGTPDSLIWKDFSGTYLGKTYTLNGSLNDFKTPKINTTMSGEDINLDASVANNGNTWKVTTLKGNYFDIRFDTTGSVTLPPGKGPVLDLQSTVSLNIEKALPLMPPNQRKLLESYGLKGNVILEGHVGGDVSDWKNLASNVTIKIPKLTVMGYHLNDINLTINQHDGKLSNTTLDTSAYHGKFHGVLNLDLGDPAMPFDIALNIDAIDLQQLKKDIPSLESKDIKGKFYLTTVGNGKVTDINNMTAKGSLAIREGFLTEFKMFEGILGILNEVLRLGQLMITDVEGNFNIANQKITTDNLHLISPSIVLLTQGWVDLSQKCDLNVSVDMTTGVIPPVAEQVLRTLNIHIYDKISAPKFDKKISVPQVINSIMKTIGIFQ